MVIELEAAAKMRGGLEMLVRQRLQFGQLQVADFYRHVVVAMCDHEGHGQRGSDDVVVFMSATLLYASLAR